MKKKIDLALRLFKAASKMAASKGQLLEVAYSGGKDSDVILELARMADIPYRAIYRNTTIDPPGTIAHAAARGVEVMRPEKSFLECIKEAGFPTRFRRHCCTYLKEYKILDYVAIGVRREESRKRAERYHEPEQCRVYRNGEKVRQYFPILEWTSGDIAEFVKERGIKCHPLYYDEQGFFHPERRLGCMCCPLKSRALRLADFRKHPGMVRFYLRGGRKFMESHPDSKTCKRFEDVYEWLCKDLFCDNLDEFDMKFRHSLFGKADCKELLEDYFGIDLKL